MPSDFTVVTTLIDLVGELVLTCATLTLVILIYRQVSLNQQHNRVLIRPIVAVEKYPHRSKLVLSFKNYGTGTAMGVQARIIAETSGREDTGMTNVGIALDKLSDALSGKDDTRVTNVGVIRPSENRNETFENVSLDPARSFKVALRYTDIEKNSYRDEFTIQP